MISPLIIIFFNDGSRYPFKSVSSFWFIFSKTSLCNMTSVHKIRSWATQFMYLDDLVKRLLYLALLSQDYHFIIADNILPSVKNTYCVAMKRVSVIILRHTVKKECKYLLHRYSFVISGLPEYYTIIYFVKMKCCTVINFVMLTQ